MPFGGGSGKNRGRVGETKQVVLLHNDYKKKIVSDTCKIELNCSEPKSNQNW